MDDDKLSITELIALSTAIAFVLSLVRFYGISITLSTPILKYFTPSDYLNQAIQWMPPTAAGWVGGLFISSLIDRLSMGKPRSTPTRQAVPKYRPFLPLTVLALAADVAYTIVYFIKREALEILLAMYGGTGMIFWIGFAGWYLANPEIRSKWTRARILAFLFLPPITWMSFFSGMSDGVAKLERPKHTVVITLEDRTIQGDLMFLLDRYSIIRTKAGETIIIDSADIKVVEE